jgi:hypothetical protein
MATFLLHVPSPDGIPPAPRETICSTIMHKFEDRFRPKAAAATQKNRPLKQKCQKFEHLVSERMFREGVILAKELSYQFPS